MLPVFSWFCNKDEASQGVLYTNFAVEYAVWKGKDSELVTNKKSNLMDQSPSWEANSSAASQIPYILWNQKVHYLPICA